MVPAEQGFCAGTEREVVFVFVGVSVDGDGVSGSEGEYTDDTCRKRYAPVAMYDYIWSARGFKEWFHWHVQI